MRGLCLVTALAVGSSTPAGVVAAPEAATDEVAPDEVAPDEVAPDEAAPDEAEATATDQPSEPDAPATDPTPPADEPAPAPALRPSPATPPPPPTVVEVDPRNYSMVLAGDILIGIGGAGLVAMGIGLGIRSDAVSQREGLNYVSDPEPGQIERQDQRIRTGSVLAAIGGATAGVFMITGITLVALGYRRERLRRASAPMASLSPTGASVGWSLRF